MNELIKERLLKSIGKWIIIFLKNDFRYEGKLTGCDNSYVEIIDRKTNSYRVIELNKVAEVEIKREMEERGK